MTEEELNVRLDRIDARTMELSKQDGMAPDVEQLASKAWLDAQDTAIGQPTKERMVAFAEELFGAKHPGAPTE